MHTHILNSWHCTSHYDVQDGRQKVPDNLCVLSVDPIDRLHKPRCDPFLEHLRDPPQFPSPPQHRAHKPQCCTDPLILVSAKQVENILSLAPFQDGGGDVGAAACAGRLQQHDRADPGAEVSLSEDSEEQMDEHLIDALSDTHRAHDDIEQRKSEQLDVSVAGMAREGVNKEPRPECKDGVAAVARDAAEYPQKEGERRGAICVDEAAKSCE